MEKGTTWRVTYYNGRRIDEVREFTSSGPAEGTLVTPPENPNVGAFNVSEPVPADNE